MNPPPRPLVLARLDPERHDVPGDFGLAGILVLDFLLVDSDTLQERDAGRTLADLADDALALTRSLMGLLWH